MVGQESLFSYYTINFNIMTYYQWSPEYMDNMIPWERKVYISLLENHVKERNEEIKRANQMVGRSGTIEHP